MNSMQENHIEVSKTARFYTLGEKDASEIWYLLHGYGMSAISMLKSVGVANKKDLLWVAPEALSRFYWNGFSGPVVASWMTKDDRENEIRNYVNYLNALNDKINTNQKPINILGFSQGVATACRWLAHSPLTCNKIVLWAGEPPPDIDYHQIKHKFKKMFVVYGNQDPFIQSTQIDKMNVVFEQAKIDFNRITFEGKHELNNEVIESFIL
jgi:predicted esterase